MELFETAGNVAGTALRIEPTGDGRLVMTAMHRATGRRDSVILRPEWLLPLGAWFAGEARSGIVGHDEYGLPYGRWLAINGDESAEVVGVHTEARLDCLLPFGTARVTVSVRRGRSSLVVMLSPEARQKMAAWLRRAAVQHPVTPGATA